MSPPRLSLDEAKRNARAQALFLREGCDPALGEELARHVLAAVAFPAGAVVAGFWSRGTEIDIRPLMHALHERGCPLVLPRTPPKGSPLVFQLWSPGVRMIAERFGGEYPDGPEMTPSILLIPLVAFDAAGNRLGYGGGYYDRTLAELPGVRTIGCAFAAQELPHVPVGPFDRRLDAVATEKGVRFFA